MKIHDTNLLDQDLDDIAKIQSLQKLSISNTGNVTRLGLQHLAKLPQQTEIDFGEHEIEQLGFLDTIRIQQFRKYWVDVAVRIGKAANKVLVGVAAGLTVLALAISIINLSVYGLGSLWVAINQRRINIG